ncbi:MAG TPA: MOSC domain-containing protein [Acidobacteriaceae bacterium]|nr:MOSC domain-containing protein [Acidobacteriaceae bacterium]
MENPGKVYSINVSGALREVRFGEEIITTGFFKEPVAGTVVARQLGLEGDAQGDLKVHGGLDKAVYFYPREHYKVWMDVLKVDFLPPGSFGENITSEGIYEMDLCIGDVIRIGGALLQIRQPRSPCYKLQLRFGRPDIVALFVKQSLPGWYASVLQEGTLSSGDEIAIVTRAPQRVSVADIWHYSLLSKVNYETQERVAQLALLPAFWKERIANART